MSPTIGTFRYDIEDKSLFFTLKFDRRTSSFSELF